MRGTRKQDVPKRYRAALPAFSVNTQEEADQLKILFCRYGYTDGEYRFTDWIPGELDSLYKATDALREAYTRLSVPPR